MKIRVSIIVCTRNRAKDLRETLESISRTDVPDDLPAELLIVDNASTDRTPEVVRCAAPMNMIPVRYVHEPRKGKGYAYNTGMAEAVGEIFLFTDDDVRVPANWIEGMCRPISNGEADAVQGGIRIAPHLERPWLRGMLRVWLAAVEDPRRAPEGLVGANMAFSRTAAACAGAFDPRLGPGAAGYYDDTIFGWSLARAGQRIAYRPEVAVEHHFDADRIKLASFLSVAQRMAESRAIAMHSIDPSTAGPSFMCILNEAPGMFVRCVTQIVRWLKNGEPDSGFLARYYRLCLWMSSRRVCSATPESRASRASVVSPR